MARTQLDRTLEALGGARGDFDARREILERASHGMLNHPALGGQLVARLCATPGEDPTAEDMGDLLAAVLDSARVARESGRKRGDTFLMAVEEALELAAGRGALGADHRLVLARIWARNGLAAPASLELTAEDAEASREIDLPADRDGIDAMLDDLFNDLLREAEGDAQAVHAALAETFPAMPAEMRAAVVQLSITRPDPIHAQLGCFWLLDPSPEIRRAAATGLAQRLGAGLLTAETTAPLSVLRTWMPADAARELVDQLLRDAMRAGLDPAQAPPPWTVHAVRATLPDGGGAQSFGMALQSGKRRAVAMVLLKQDHGVKDAYVVPCQSASDQTTLMARLAEDTGALPVPLDHLEYALSMALGDGLAQGLPPAPGLIDVASLCGLTALRPGPADTDSLLARLDAAARVSAMSAQKRGRRINASRDWWERHELVRYWFEESDSAHELMETARSPRAAERALWQWLESRRNWWAHQIARSAAMLEAAGHSDADSFAATAMALRDGRELRKIPVMGDIHAQTFEAWAFDDPDMGAEAPQEGFVELASDASQPEPEGKGELAKLLRGATMSADRIDGYLMSITIAPKVIQPNRWLPEILESAMATCDMSDLQRILDLVMLRANDAIALAETDGAFACHMDALAPEATRDWATGFTQGCKSFKSTWPAKATGPDDQAMQRLIASAAETRLTGADIRTIGQWIVARHAANQQQDA